MNVEFDGECFKIDGVKVDIALLMDIFSDSAHFYRFSLDGDNVVAERFEVKDLEGLLR